MIMPVLAQLGAAVCSRQTDDFLYMWLLISFPAWAQPSTKGGELRLAPCLPVSLVNKNSKARLLVKVGPCLSVRLSVPTVELS